ncbi:unnamed protein product [Heterotrigona itama]|uniref:Uncharacterized protein n=1 Tax=Heterotrigona itama TaxID=395501 RepID=A0A6V7GT44_9HYME|nr:unnamed protein product [Heterotrigona itama]
MDNDKSKTNEEKTSATQLGGDPPHSLIALHQIKKKTRKEIDTAFTCDLDSDQNIEFHDNETNEKHTNTNYATQNPTKLISPPTRIPIYIHRNINHTKLLDALKMKYNNNFQAKFICSKLKMSAEKCFYDKFRENLYSGPKRVLPGARICENLKNQGLNPILCSEFPTHTRHLIYKLTFALITTLTQLNHVRYYENIKLHWEKYEA